MDPRELLKVQWGEDNIRRPAKDWSYAQTLDIVRTILGPMTRVYYKKGAPDGQKDVMICMYRGGARFPLGYGDTFFDAIVNTFVRPMARREELAAELKRLKESKE